jgi:hypothetical protein
MKTVSKQQILVTLTLRVTQTRMQMLVWTGNNGRRYVLGMRSPLLRAPTQISGIRNAIQFRILRDCTRKGEVAPKLTLLLNAINLLIARNFTGGSLHWTFRLLIAEVLPHCEASKKQLRILHELFRDTFDSITSFFLAVKLAQSSVNTLLHVPALVADNENTRNVEPLPF